METKNIADLDFYLKKFNLHYSLIEIGRASISLFNRHKCLDNFPIKIGIETKNVTIAQWQLAFLAYRLIMSSNDGKREMFGYKELLWANSIFAQFGDPLGVEKDIVGFFGRLSQEQFWWQVNQSSSFARNYLLLVEFSKDASFKSRINLEEVFNNEYGISIYDYMAIGWGVLSVCLIRPVFNKDNLLKHSVPAYKDIMTRDKLDRFLYLVSSPYNKIRNISAEVNKLILPLYEKYQFNPLFRYPIIESDSRFMNFYSEAPYIVPNILLLIRKVAYGAYWELREIFRVRNSRDFLAFFGDIFNLYVGKILIKFFGQDNVKELPKDLSIKIADWIVVSDDSLVIFECKSQLLPYLVRETFNEYELKEWIDRNIVGGIEQLFSTEDYLLKNDIKGIKVGNRKVYKVVVTFEQIYLIESRGFKNRIIKSVEDKGIFKKYKHTANDFYIISTHELELMQNIIEKFTLTDIFNEKQATDKRDNIAEGNDFISIFHHLDSNIKLRNDWLDETFHKYFDNFIPDRIPPNKS